MHLTRQFTHYGPRASIPTTKAAHCLPGDCGVMFSQTEGANVENELVQNSDALSAIMVAAIGAGAGLCSGVIASLIAPWVQYAIETRKKSFEYKRQKILEIRELLDNNRDMNEIEKSSLWGFISANLNEQEKKMVFPRGIVVRIPTDGSRDTLSQDDYKKQGISDMLYRLEKEWKLIKT